MSLDYLHRSTISSADLLEPSLPMANSAVTENIPKETEGGRHQHKVVNVRKPKVLRAPPLLASGFTCSQSPSVILRDDMSQSHVHVRLCVCDICVTYNHGEFSSLSGN